MNLISWLASKCLYNPHLWRKYVPVYTLVHGSCQWPLGDKSVFHQVTMMMMQSVTLPKVAIAVPLYLTMSGLEIILITNTREGPSLDHHGSKELQHWYIVNWIWCAQNWQCGSDWQLCPVEVSQNGFKVIRSDLIAWRLVTTHCLSKLLWLIHLQEVWIQVAQLWQRECAKLASFLINIHLYLQNHEIAFLSHPMGNQGQYKHFMWKFSCKESL